MRGDQRQRDRQNISAGDAAVQHGEIDKAEQPGRQRRRSGTSSRPIRSERYPDNGTVKSPARPTSTAVSRKLRDMVSVPRLGEDEGGEDIERRLLDHPQQRRQMISRLPADHFQRSAPSRPASSRPACGRPASPRPAGSTGRRRSGRCSRNGTRQPQARKAIAGQALKPAPPDWPGTARRHAELRPGRDQAARPCCCPTIPSPAAPSRPIRRRRRCPE